MTGKIHEWINVWILGKCLAVWVPQRGCTGSGALKWNKKTTTIYLLLSKRKMLFFLTFLFLTCSKYPFCSFFSQRRFFFFWSHKLSIVTTQNSRIKYFILKCRGSQAALSSNWRRTSVLTEGLLTTPPNFHIYDCCQNCCAYTQNFFIGHYYATLWVFYEPIWSRPNMS